MPFSKSVPLFRLIGLITSLSLILPSLFPLSLLSTAGNASVQTPDKVKRTKGAPSPNLPNLDEARGINPGPPQAPPPVPATKCRRLDTACKKKHGETSINQPRFTNDGTNQLIARVDDRSRRSRFAASEKVTGRNFRTPAVDALLDKHNRPLLDSPAGVSHRAPYRNSRNAAALKAAAGFVMQTEAAWQAALLDPNNRKGTPGEDLLSGNFNWGLSLLSLPGRAGLDLGLTLSLNSLVWTKANSSIYFDLDYGFPAPGFQIGFPSIRDYYFNPQTGTYAYQMLMPSGRRVEFRQVNTNVYEAADSSYMQLTYNPGDSTFTLPTTDGTQLKFEFKLAQYRCTEIKARNGNYITITYHEDFGSGQEINTITDTLGRVITFNYDPQYLRLISITQSWGGQTPHVWATFVYGLQTIQTNFPGLTMPNAYNG